MWTLFWILLVAALVIFGYLWYRVGWKEAAGAVVALAAGVGAAIVTFVGHFGGATPPTP